MRINKKTISIVMALVLLIIPSTTCHALNLEKQYIHHNRSNQPLNPIGLVIHDTDNEGATAQNNHDYFNRVYVGASAHYFVDWNKAIKTIPENEVAWHAGYTANHKFLSIEMCVPKNNNQSEFNKVYENTVELAAKVCKEHGWTSQQIYSHRYCSYTWHQTDHEDPYAFLKQFGKSWSDLLSDIQKRIDGQAININNPLPTNHSNINANATIKVNSSLNVRESAWGNIIGKVFENERIEVLNTNGDWSYIKYNTSNGSKKGYVYSNYVKLDKVKTIKTIIASCLNVRDEASTNSNVIGQVFNGEKVQVKWTVPGWHYIKYNTNNGYKEGYA
ncbi:MAG: N-acetylmuramoyl-L-alanine amidase, partial [Sarcina sp.]